METVTQLIAAAAVRHRAALLGEADRLAGIVARAFGIRVAFLLGRSTKRVYAYPRQVLTWLLFTELNAGIAWIAWFTNRDRATVRYAIRLVEGLIETNERDRETIARITEALKQPAA